MSNSEKQFIMRKILYLFILSISLSGLCQETKKEDYSPSKWRLGGGLGLGFGSNGYFGFSISPFVVKTLQAIPEHLPALALDAAIGLGVVERIDGIAVA